MGLFSSRAGERRVPTMRALRRAAAVGGTLAGTGAIMVALSLPAGASGLTSPANSTLIGSGSSTTYYLMQGIDTLFNDSPGCQQFVPFPSATTPQNLDYSCSQPPTTAANPENPYNDISVQEAPLGSSSGIAQLQDQGSHGATATSGGVPINVANNISYARSSRALKSSDLEGLNFVGYAQDGVSWFHYTAVGGVSTPSAGVTNLTKAQLQGIWNGTYTNWSQLGGNNAPIVVFSAQEGSGTQGTWSTYLGYDPSAAGNPVNCYVPTGKTAQTCVGPAVIFENEDAQIRTTAFTSPLGGGTGQAAFVGAKNPDWGGKKATNADIESDAVFFFSYGRYQHQCQIKKTECGGSPLGKGTTNALPNINGVTLSEATILEGLWPVDRYLYNVYSNGYNYDLNGSTTTINPSTAATLNYVSEIGFICNPDKGGSTSVVDPNTGKSYISELQSTMLNFGFYPLSAGSSSGVINQTPIDEGSVPHPASAMLTAGTVDGFNGAGTGQYGYSNYKSFDSYATNTSTGDPMGYCLTYTTDSNPGT
jgi:ABC-type phosphate transport system substrate-binding protein